VEELGHNGSDDDDGGFAFLLEAFGEGFADGVEAHVNGVSVQILTKRNGVRCGVENKKGLDWLPKVRAQKCDNQVECAAGSGLL
jgi:hypothetical protein